MRDCVHTASSEPQCDFVCMHCRIQVPWEPQLGYASRNQRPRAGKEEEPMHMRWPSRNSFSLLTPPTCPHRQAAFHMIRASGRYYWFSH